MTTGPYPNQPWPLSIQEAYDRLRQDCEHLEELLANSQGLEDKFLKRADKSVTVMKAVA